MRGLSDYFRGGLIHLERGTSEREAIETLDRERQEAAAREIAKEDEREATQEDNTV